MTTTETRLREYRRFLEGKVRLADGSGFPCELVEVNPALKPHQRAMVAWAVRGGRRALFASFGLGKTLVQLETLRLILAKAGGGRGLIILPLGEMHLCPLQFDIVDRVITQMSMPGEVVYDPFSGLGTVPLRAVKLGRQGLGVELSPSYHADAVYWLHRAEQEAAAPTMFDLADAEEPG